MNLKERIELRKAAKQAAAEMAELLTACCEDASEVYIDAFWAALIEAFPQRLATPVKTTAEEPWTDQQARAFGQTHIPFGIHAGALVDEVPLEYLVWLVDQPDDFKQKLRKYIRSKRIQQELEQ